MSGSVLLHRQRSEDLQQLLAWYKIRDTLLGENRTKQEVKQALDFASVCGHPNAVWLTKLFDGREVASREEASQIFLGGENDPRALCFAALFRGPVDEIRRAADLGDAFAITFDEEGFRWAEKSSAQGERDGFLQLGIFYQFGLGCENDPERAQELFRCR